MPRRNNRALDDALDERNKLFAEYKRAKKAEREKLFADPLYGDKLRKFIANLNHFGPEDSDRFVDYVNRSLDGWLNRASLSIRQTALEACDERIQKIRVSMGLPALSDPLPEQEDDVFRICKKAIGI